MSSLRRVTMCDSVQVHVFDPFESIRSLPTSIGSKANGKETKAIVPEEGSQTQANPYVMDLMLDDSVLDPTYIPEKNNFEAVDESTEGSEVTIREDLLIEASTTQSGRARPTHDYNLRTNRKPANNKPLFQYLYNFGGIDPDEKPPDDETPTHCGDSSVEEES